MSSAECVVWSAGGHYRPFEIAYTTRCAVDRRRNDRPLPYLYVTCHCHTSFQNAPHRSSGILKIHTGALVGIRLQFARFNGRLLSARSPGTRARIAAQQDLLERLPEHLVEDGVEDGVHHGASVAQPGDHVEDPVANSFLALRAHRGQEIEDEEWRPEDYERKEHHSQHLGGLLLQPDDPAVARGVSGDHAGVPRVMRSHRLLTLQHAGWGCCRPGLATTFARSLVVHILVTPQGGRSSQRCGWVGGGRCFGGRQQQGCSHSAKTAAPPTMTTWIPRDHRGGLWDAQLSSARTRSSRSSQVPTTIALNCQRAALIVSRVWTEGGANCGWSRSCRSTCYAGTHTGGQWLFIATTAHE